MGASFPTRSVVAMLLGFLFLGAIVLLGLPQPTNAAVVGVRESVTEFVDDVLDNASDKLDTAMVGVEEVVQLAEEKAAHDAASGAKGPALAAVHTMKNNVLGGVFAKKTHTAAQLVDDTMEALMNVKDGKVNPAVPAAMLKEFLMVKDQAKPPLLSAVLTAAKDVKNEVHEKANDTGEKLAGAVVVQEVAKKLDNLLDRAEPVMGDLTAHYDEVAGEVQGVLEGVQDAAADTVHEAAGVVEEVVADAAEAMEGIANDMHNAVGDATGEVHDVASDVADEVHNVVGDAANEVHEAVQDAGEEVHETFGDIAEEVHDTVEDVLPPPVVPALPILPLSAEAAARRRLFLAEKFEQKTGVAVDDAVKAMSGLAAFANEGERQIRNSAVNVGKAVLNSVSEGAAEGLKAKVQDAADLVQKVATHATDAVPVAHMDKVASGVKGATEKIIGANNKVADAATTATTGVINKAAELKTRYNDGRAEIHDSINEVVTNVALDIVQKADDHSNGENNSVAALAIVEQLVGLEDNDTDSHLPGFLITSALPIVAAPLMATVEHAEEHVKPIAQAVIDEKAEAVEGVMHTTADVVEAIHDNFIGPMKEEAEKKRMSLFAILTGEDSRTGSQEEEADEEKDAASLVDALAELVGAPAENWFNALQHHSSEEEVEGSGDTGASQPQSRRRMLASLLAKDRKKDALIKKLKEAKDWKKQGAKNLVNLIPLKKIASIVPDASNLLHNKKVHLLKKPKMGIVDSLLHKTTSEAIEGIEKLLKKNGIDDWAPLDHLEYIPVINNHF